MRYIRPGIDEQTIDTESIPEYDTQLYVVTSVKGENIGGDEDCAQESA
jgi:hypothetical protein